MNAFDIWAQCRQFSIVLTASGDRLRYYGPHDAIQRMIPVLKENKTAVLACIAEIDGRPIEDGPFTPWVAPASPDQLIVWQNNLLCAVEELAALEGWTEAHLDHVVCCIERQPISTLRPDLTYFLERLAKALSDVRSRTVRGKNG
jgi:hypothetical protein